MIIDHLASATIHWFNHKRKEEEEEKDICKKNWFCRERLELFLQSATGFYISSIGGNRVSWENT